MPSMELTEHESRVLRDVLESYLREVSFEISNSEKLEFRENLKRERETIMKVLTSL